MARSKRKESKAKLWALISVSDKTDLGELGQALKELGIEIISTGGTARFLEGAGVSPIPVEKVTGVSEMLDGRVKTLAYQIYASILARNTQGDQAELKAKGIEPIKIVVANLYPFERTVASGASWKEIIENIDIGGVSLLRAAAKNAGAGVVVVCDPADYARVIEALKTKRGVSKQLRQELAEKAFEMTARYDAAILKYLASQRNGLVEAMFLRRVMELAYAENRNQNPATLFTLGGNDPLAMSKFDVVSGGPSYISIADGAGLVSVLRFLAESFRKLYGEVPYIFVAGKHGNVCGIGVDWNDPKIALRKALMGDKTAVMGGEVVTNCIITDELGAELLSPPASLSIGRKNWGLDIILAPGFSDQAVEILGRREKRRLLSNPALADPQMPTEEWMWRLIDGGDFLRQKAPQFILTRETIEEWVGVPLDDDRFEDLLIAWAACWRASSNTVALAKNRMLIGLGCGQQDRIACVRLCIERARRAGHATEGAVFASDAFFPYAEGEQPPVDLAKMGWLLRQAKAAERKGNRREMIKWLGELNMLISQSDRREGTELLIDAGCIGGVVPADGKNLEEVKALFAKAGLSVAFLNKLDRGFAKH